MSEAKVGYEKDIPLRKRQIIAIIKWQIAYQLLSYSPPRCSFGDNHCTHICFRAQGSAMATCKLTALRVIKFGVRATDDFHIKILGHHVSAGLGVRAGLGCLL